MMKYKCQKCGRDQPDDMTKECVCVKIDAITASREKRRQDIKPRYFEVISPSGFHVATLKLWADMPGNPDEYEVTWTITGGLTLNGGFTGIDMPCTLRTRDTLVIHEYSRHGHPIHRETWIKDNDHILTERLTT